MFDIYVFWCCWFEKIVWFKLTKCPCKILESTIDLHHFWNTLRCNTFTIYPSHLLTFLWKAKIGAWKIIYWIHQCIYIGKVFVKLLISVQGKVTHIHAPAWLKYQMCLKLGCGFEGLFLLKRQLEYK